MRRIPTTIAAVAGLAAGVVIGGTLLAQANTGESTVPPVDVPDLVLQGEAPLPPAPVGGVVPGLVERTGVVAAWGDDFALDGVELDIGADWWAASTSAGADLDGDGRTGSWTEEVRGLVGREVTVLGELDDGDLDAFAIEGVAVRPALAGPPPWAGGPDRDQDGDRDRDWDGDGDWAEVDPAARPAETISSDEAIRIALGQVPGTVDEVVLVRDEGRIVWDVDVRTGPGAEIGVEIDAVTGAILEVEPE